MHDDGEVGGVVLSGRGLHLTTCVLGLHALRGQPGASHDSCQVNI